jgi:general secretion pathway protein I
MHRPARGFTLLEILVALAVLALSLGALVTAVSSQTRNTAYLVERTLAQWVAGNALAQIRLEGTWSEPGERSGRSEMGGRSWTWRAVSSATDDPDLQRLEVSVAPDETGEALVTLVAYHGRPARERG